MDSTEQPDLIGSYARYVRAKAILGELPASSAAGVSSDGYLAARSKMALADPSSPTELRAKSMSFLLDRQRRQAETVDDANHVRASSAKTGKELAERIIELQNETGGDSAEIYRRIQREGWDRSLITPDTILAIEDQERASSAAGEGPQAMAMRDARKHMLALQPSKSDGTYAPPDFEAAGVYPDRKNPLGIKGAAYSVPGAPPNGYKDPTLKKTLGDALTSGRVDQIPFAGPAWSFVTRQLPAIIAAHKINTGEAAATDYATLAEYQAGLIRDAITPKTTLNKTAEFVKDSASLGIELAAGGLLTAPKKAAEKLVRNRAEKSIVRAAVGAAADAAASLPGQGGRIAETAGSRMIPGVSGADGGGVAVAGADGVAPAIAKGVLDTYIENLSERIGEVGKLLPGGKFVGRMRENLLNRLGIDPASKGAKVIDEIARAGGYNGPLPEIGEEYFGGLLKWATGLQDSPNAIPMDDLPAFALSTLVPGGATLAAKGAYAMTQRGGGSAAAGPVSESTTAPQEPTNEEGQEEGRKEGLLSPEAATTPEAATPGADKPPAPADRVGMAYRSELKRMGYSETEIDGMDRAKALEIIRGQQRAFEGFVGAIEQAPEAVGTPTAHENAPEGLGAESGARGDSVEERAVEAGGGVAGQPEGEGLGVDEPGDVRPVADRVETVVGDEGVAAGDQSGDVGVIADNTSNVRQDDYHMGHRPNPTGPRAFDLLETYLAPNDIYDSPQFYVGDAQDRAAKESIRALKAIRGKPTAMVTVYRAAPAGSKLNPGDWVSLSKTYATRHGISPDDDSSKDLPVLSMKVRASDVRWAGDDLNEFGYFPGDGLMDVEPGTPTTVPERPETIKAQLDELKAGKRPAVLVTPGAKSAVPPKGMKALRTKAGRFIYDPEQLTTEQIQAAVREDRIGDVLGYGIANKPAPEDAVGVVTVRDADGVEKRAVVTDAANLESVVAEAQNVSGPSDTVSIEHPKRVLSGREDTAGARVDVQHARNRLSRLAMLIEMRHARTDPVVTAGQYAELKTHLRDLSDAGVLTTADLRSVKSVMEIGALRQAVNAPVYGTSINPSLEKMYTTEELGAMISTLTPSEIERSSVFKSWVKSGRSRQEARVAAFNQLLAEVRQQPVASFVAEAQKVAEPGDTVAVEKPEAVLRDRAQGAQKDAPGRAIEKTDAPVVSDARYAKGMKAVTYEKSGDGFKPKAARLAEALGGKWSNRERAYIMSPSNAERLLRLYNDGWDASAIEKTLIEPGTVRNPIEDAPGRSGAQNGAPRPVAKMKNSELRAELEAGGVEVPEGTKRKALVSGVEELRRMPKTEAAVKDSKMAMAESIIETSKTRRNRLQQDVDARETPAIWIDNQIITETGKYEYDGNRLVKVQELSRVGFEKNLKYIADADGSFFGMNVHARRLADKIKADRAAAEEQGRADAARREAQRQTELAEDTARALKIDEEINNATFRPVKFKPAGVDGELSGQAFRGLAVVKIQGANGWTINQVSSGLRLPVTFITRDAAKRAAVRMAGLASWETATQSQLEKTKNLYQSIKAIERNLYAKLETIVPPTVTDKIIAKADAVEKAARSRIAKRQIPRGRNVGGSPIIGDAIDYGIILAAKVAKTGVKAARGFKTELDRIIAENPTLSKYRNDIARVARRVIRESRGADGTFDADKMDESIGRLYQRMDTEKVSVKRAVNETAGVRRMEPKTLTGAEALARSLKREAKAARGAFSAGVQAGVANIMPKLDALKARLQETKAHQGVRDELVRLVRENLPPEIHGRFLTDVRDARTTQQLSDSIEKMRRTMTEYDYRLAKREAKSAAKRANPKKMLEEFREVVQEARRAVENAREIAEKSKPNASGGRTVTLHEDLNVLRQQADVIREAAKRMLEAAAQQKLAEKIRVGNKIVQREELVKRAVADIEKRPGIKTKDPLERATSATLKGRARIALWNADTIGEAIGNVTTHRLLTKEMWDGETLVNRDTHEAMEFLKKTVQDALFEWGSRTLRSLSAGTGGKRARVETLSLPSGTTLKATPAELGALYATLTDADAGRNIRNGAPIVWRRDQLGDRVKLTPDDVDTIIENVDPTIKDIVDRLKQYVEDKVRPGVFAAFREQKGYDLILVKGYWRTRRSMTPTADSGLIGPVSKYMNQALEELGFLKERSPDTKKPYVIGDVFEDFHDMAYQGAVVSHMTRRVRQAEYLFQTQELRRAIETRFGRQMNQRIDDHIEAGKLIFVEPKSTIEKVATFLSKQTARSVLTLNPGTMAKQIGGVFKLGAVMEAGDIRRGVASAGSERVGRLLRESAYFQNRYDESIWRRMSPTANQNSPLLGQGSTLDLVKGVQIGQLVDKINLLNKFDAVVARTALAGKIAEAERLHPSWTPDQVDEYAVREAEYAIRRTQNSHSPLDMSGLALRERGRLGSALLMFTSDSNKSWNLLASAVQSGDKKRVASAFAAVAMNNAWAAAVSTALGREFLSSVMGGGGDDDKDGTAWGRFLREFVKNTTGMVYFGEIPQYVLDRGMRAYSGKPLGAASAKLDYPGAQGLDGVLGAVDNLLKAAFQDGTMASGKDKRRNRRLVYLERAAKDAIEGTSVLAGVPLIPALGLYRRVRDAIQKDERSPSSRRSPARP